MKIGSERSLPYRALVFLAAVVAALLSYALAARAPLAAPELAASDALVRLAPAPTRPDIAVVALDGPSVGKYGPIQHWPRALLAQALSRVEAAGAKTVVYDLALDKRKPDDVALWRAIATHRNVVLGMSYEAAAKKTVTPDDTRALVFLERDAIADKLVLGPQTQTFAWQLFDPPLSDYTGSARGVGVFPRETQPDGIVRDARLFYTSKADYTGMPPLPAGGSAQNAPQSRLADGAPVALPNLALVAALRVLGLDKDSVRIATGDTVRLAGNLNPPVNIPVDDQGHMRIRYPDGAARTLTYSFADIATQRQTPDLTGKTVLFGATAPGDPVTQFCATPFGKMPRVFLTAAALSTLLDRSYVRVVAVYPRALLGTLLLAALMIGLCLMMVSGGRALLVTVLLLVAYLVLTWALYAFNHALLPIVPVLLVLLLTYLTSLALYLGPYRPKLVGASPTYIPPPPRRTARLAPTNTPQTAPRSPGHNPATPDPQPNNNP